MAERRPLVLVNGAFQELPVGDTLPGASGLQNNYTATAAPTVTDDNGSGYAVGSRWIDTTNDKEYVCLDASTGAAIWTETTASGGGTSTFVGLSDTPANFTGQSLKMLRVNAGETALEYVNAPTNGTNGTDGVDGNTVLYGTVDPTTEGVDGDFYINTTSNTIFGPKATIWPTGTSLIGPAGADGADGAAGANGDNGSVWYTGSGVPSDAGLGVDGDYYFDLDTGLNLYGPKTGGAWGNATSILLLQSSFTDDTTNAVMQTGAFGIGKINGLAITDFTGTLYPGIYRFSEATAIGSPDNKSFPGMAIVMATTGGNAVIAFRQTENQSNARIWMGIRASTTGAFVWTSVFHAGNLTELSDESSTSYSLTDSDLQGNIIKKMTNSSAITFTIPSGLTGTQPVTVIKEGAGDITFTASSTTLNSKDNNLKITDQWAAATIIPMGSNEYVIIGDLTA